MNVPLPPSLGLVAPLGLRLWDPLFERAVTEGLAAWAYDEALPEVRSTGYANRSGVFAFRNLAGRRALEFGSGDAAYWASAIPQQRAYTVEIRDPETRFLPFRLRDVRAPWRGLYSSDLEPASPPDVARVSLFSAPTRIESGPFAVVRAELREPQPGDPKRTRPAPWAIVELDVPGREVPVQGMADRDGRIQLLFPYPEPEGGAFVSPPGGPALLGQEWRLPLRVLFTRPEPVPETPDLRATVLGQAPAVAWESDSPLSAPLDEAVVRFGHTTVLRSRESATGDALTYVLITGGGSPPS
jgi:hypothetical protein